jgi:hypothetical protein
VSGTGLFGHAPYAIAEDRSTRWSTPAAVAASSVSEMPVMALPTARQRIMIARGEVHEQ